MITQGILKILVFSQVDKSAVKTELAWLKKTLKYVISLGWSPVKNWISSCHKKQAPNLTDSFYK